MIGIKSKRKLARILGLPSDNLVALSQDLERFVRHYALHDPAKPEHARAVIAVRGELRLCQRRLLERLFRKCFVPAACSHGGVPGRSIKTNAKAHLNSAWVFTTDISRFYPSIHHKHVYRFLAKEEGCGPDVASLVTKLCTCPLATLPTAQLDADRAWSNAARPRR